MTKKEAAHKLLKPRRWVNMGTIKDTLGPSGDRVVRHLRDQYEIKTRRNPDTNETEYRLVGVA